MGGGSKREDPQLMIAQLRACLYQACFKDNIEMAFHLLNITKWLRTFVIPIIG